MQTLKTTKRTFARLAAMALVALYTACSSDSPAGPDDDPDDEPDPGTTETGTIAYARGGEIRLIEPDGSEDRAVWTAPRPELEYTVSGLAWKPDGREIAFSSDHEQATSFYQRDIYAIRPDGSRLRKLTNAPTLDELDEFPTGTVTVDVLNESFESGPYLIYVAGAPEPQVVTISPGSGERLTFRNVADFDNGLQPVVAVFGIYRWFNSAAAEVESGETVDAGTLVISGEGFRDFGAQEPTWRSDGEKLGFPHGPGCTVLQVPDDPSPGFSFQPLLDPNAIGSACEVDWAPIPSIEDQLLFTPALPDFGSDERFIYQTTEGSLDRGEQVLTYTSGDYVYDLKWLPDGSGFLFTITGNFFGNANLYEYLFATSTVRQLTDFTDEFVRHFSISPDGEEIVFERAASAEGESDLWLMRRDGSDMRLMVPDAAWPAWNPQRR